MAIIASDRDLIINSILDFVGEDYYLAARVLVALEARFPAVAWRANIVTVMNGRPEYLASGLSRAWWQAEVVRQADAMKG